MLSCQDLDQKNSDTIILYFRAYSRCSIADFKKGKGAAELIDKFAIKHAYLSKEDCLSKGKHSELGWISPNAKISVIGVKVNKTYFDKEKQCIWEEEQNEIGGQDIVIIYPTEDSYEDDPDATEEVFSRGILNPSIPRSEPLLSMPKIEITWGEKKIDNPFKDYLTNEKFHRLMSDPEFLEKEKKNIETCYENLKKDESYKYKIKLGEANVRNMLQSANSITDVKSGDYKLYNDASDTVFRLYDLATKIKDDFFISQMQNIINEILRNRLANIIDVNKSTPDISSLTKKLLLIAYKIESEEELLVTHRKHFTFVVASRQNLAEKIKLNETYALIDKHLKEILPSYQSTESLCLTAPELKLTFLNKEVKISNPFGDYLTDAKFYELMRDPSKMQKEKSNIISCIEKFKSGSHSEYFEYCNAIEQSDIRNMLQDVKSYPDFKKGDRQIRYNHIEDTMLRIHDLEVAVGYSRRAHSRKSIITEKVVLAPLKSLIESDGEAYDKNFIKKCLLIAYKIGYTFEKLLPEIKVSFNYSSKPKEKISGLIKAFNECHQSLLEQPKVPTPLGIFNKTESKQAPGPTLRFGRGY